MRAKNTREKELTEFVDKHRGTIARICRGFFPFSDYLQENLFGEITYRIWQAWEGYRNDSSGTNWVYRIAINTAINFSIDRKRNNKKKFAEREYATIQKESEDPLIGKLYELINRLNAFDKAVIYMYLDRKTQSDMAATLGITETNVSTMIGRIKKKLIKLKEDEYAND